MNSLEEMEVNKLIKDLAEGDSLAYIAGGFVRDNYYEKPYRDIDIFVFTDITSNKETIETNDFVLRNKSSSEYTESDRVVYSVYSRKLDRDIIVDVIFVDKNKTPNISQLLKTFPLSICQCAVNIKSGKMITTSKFDKTQDRNIIYVKEKISDEYIRRIVEKYPVSHWLWVWDTSKEPVPKLQKGAFTP